MLVHRIVAAVCRLALRSGVLCRCLGEILKPLIVHWDQTEKGLGGVTGRRPYRAEQKRDATCQFRPRGFAWEATSCKSAGNRGFSGLAYRALTSSLSARARHCEAVYSIVLRMRGDAVVSARWSHSSAHWR